jgi:hypothetical protein
MKAKPVLYRFLLSPEAHENIRYLLRTTDYVTTQCLIENLLAREAATVKNMVAVITTVTADKGDAA